MASVGRSKQGLTQNTSKFFKAPHLLSTSAVPYKPSFEVRGHSQELPRRKDGFFPSMFCDIHHSPFTTKASIFCAHQSQEDSVRYDPVPSGILSGLRLGLLFLILSVGVSLSRLRQSQRGIQHRCPSGSEITPSFLISFSLCLGNSLVSVMGRRCPCAVSAQS